MFDVFHPQNIKNRSLLKFSFIHKHIFFVVLLTFGFPISGKAQSVNRTAGAGSNVPRAGSSAGWNGTDNTNDIFRNVSTTDNRLRGDGDFTDYLYLTDFNFNIPANSYIQGVVAYIYRGNSNQDDIYDETIQLLVGGNGAGNDKSSGNDWDNRYEFLTYGGANDLWGASLSLDQVNSPDFGLRIAAFRNTNSGTSNQRPEIDYVSMTVYYASALPVELINFTATTISENTREITWATASEINSRDFALLSSIDGMNFKEIYKQNSAGYSNAELQYSFIDRENLGLNKIVYYKLLQTDFNGKSEEFGPISLVIESPEAELLLYPNPSSDFVNVRFNETFNPDILEIYNQNGKRIKQINLKIRNTIDVHKMSSGVYLFKASNKKTGKSVTERFIKK
ncbi:MAG: T9SS type A sorting domain-containing protein [Bacteroidetes bacterium]|nr:T9SS type A sorting domain-containing protein [Bacteroidota bacterium]